MSRLTVSAATDADRIADSIKDVALRRAQALTGKACALEEAAAFFRYCSAQSCGKCTPCRVGIRRLADTCDALLDGVVGAEAYDEMLVLASTIEASADCAIGFESGRVAKHVLASIETDVESHASRDICSSAPAQVPCSAACPAHVKIPEYIACAAAGNYADAVRVIRNDNPFPSVCGFVCEHPCEDHCRRTIVDAPINIRGIKKHAVLNAGKVPTPAPLAATGKHIAIVGGGPSGLTAAYFLKLMGHDVTVFEQNDHLGGALFYGIPRYRLPKENLDYDIDAILALGVEVKYETKIGRDVSLAQLEEDFDATYIAIGAHIFKALGISDDDVNEGVFPAVEFLHTCSGGGEMDLAGKDVVIIGGGNVAMDATRTARRLGAKSVTCVYRRRIVDMTALPAEVESAMAEGCELIELAAPVRISKGSASPLELTVQPQMPGAYSWGRPSPQSTGAPEQTIACDVIVEAIGQAIESESFDAAGMKTNRGRFGFGPDARATGYENIFVGGDCATGPATVIRAIDAGKVAAANIDAALGFAHDVHDDVKIPAPHFDSAQQVGRVNVSERPAAERACDLQGVEKEWTETEAHQECGRCLRCDHHGYAAMSEGRPQSW